MICSVRKQQRPLTVTSVRAQHKCATIIFLKTERPRDSGASPEFSIFYFAKFAVFVARFRPNPSLCIDFELNIRNEIFTRFSRRCQHLKRFCELCEKVSKFVRYSTGRYGQI